MYEHTALIFEMFRAYQSLCYWGIELASPKVRREIQKLFPGSYSDDYSVWGFCPNRKESIENFWSLYKRSYEQVPWENEQPWFLAGVTKKFRDLTRSDSSVGGGRLDSLYAQPQEVHCLFVQPEVWGFMGAKRNKEVEALMQGEFPAVLK